MTRTFNPYRTWAHDGKALSQWTNTPSVIWQECKTCHHSYNTDEVTFVDDECEECQKKQAPAKQADIRYRVALKQHPGIVVYKVRSSDDTQDYDVTVVNGKVNNCTCKSRKPCYHMRDVQVRESERAADRRQHGVLNNRNAGFSLLR